MGSSKKKDKKKKKKRQYVSSSEDDYSDNDEYGYSEKYKSDDYTDSDGKRKSRSYVVEDARPKPLQAIKDNYSYSKNEKKKKRRDYDDIPETEEYIYDYSGQEIVQKARKKSASPESIDGNYELKPQKHKDAYYDDDESFQKKNYTDASADTNYTRKKDYRELPDSSGSHTRKRESKEISDYASARKNFKEKSDYISAEYSEVKGSRVSDYVSEVDGSTFDSSADYILKKIREQTSFISSSEPSESNKSSQYISSDYNKKAPSEYDSRDYEYIQNDFSKKSEYISTEHRENDLRISSYNAQKMASGNYPDRGYSDYDNTRESSNQWEYKSSDYSYKKDVDKQDNSISSDYDQKKDYIKQPDHNSSDYNYKKYSSKQTDYVTSDYNQRGNQGRAFDDYASSDYRKDTNEPTSYYSSEYNQNNDSDNQSDSALHKRKKDYKDREESISSSRSGQKLKNISLSPEEPKKMKEVKSSPPLPPPLPPGVEWPYASSSSAAEPSTYDEFFGSEREEPPQTKMSYDKEIEEEYPSKIKEAKYEKEHSTAASSKSDSSLSIEETNKLRAKLGLKPLKVDSGKSGTQEKSYADREDVHAPPTNISDKKSEEKLRERMEAIREKRKINKKLQKVKGLGEEDDPVLDSAAAWVAKSRIQEKEKAMAEKRAKMLEEMDEEFGVTKIVSKSILKKQSKYDGYSSKDLKGLKVEHRGSVFEGGENVILTLKDKDVLDDDSEDVLYNVNLRESEQAKLNIKNKSKRPGYQAYDEVDEETGEFKVRSVLDKYDEEIEGEKRDSFRIDTGGSADLDGENQIDKIRAILKSQQVSLEMQSLQPARDYYTPDELVRIKKPKKKIRKVRKRDVLKADDLLKMDMEMQKSSKKLKSALKNSSKAFEGEDSQSDMDIVTNGPDELDYFVAVNLHEELEPVIDVDDEAEQELQLALKRSRRAKLKTVTYGGDENDTVEKMAKEVLNKHQIKEEPDINTGKPKKKGKGTIILDSTSEFCRTLGDLPNIGAVPEPNHKSDDDMDLGDEAANTAGGWEQVEIKEESKDDKIEEEDDDVLDAEPIPTGLAATLNLANMKGYLKDGKEKIRRFDPLNLPETKAEVDIEKLRDEEKSKYIRGYERDRDRDRYDPYQFKEKSNYKPDVKLEYVDNKGRQMNQKEAFRLLSHKFHGKGSGKLKTEKRSKKLLDERKLQLMSSIDTPLNTASLFKDKQKQSQSAYLVLSGGGKNILSGETLKK